jgi:hypothetical protein
MKHFRIVTATLILLTGASLKSMAQSPTIQREVRLVNPTGPTGFIGLKAASNTSTYSLTMPTAAPLANQVLTVSNISGSAVTLAWNSPDATGWSLTGNTGTNENNYLGTTDAQPLVVKTNGNTRMTVGADGGITMNTLSGTNGTASSALDASVVAVGLSNPLGVTVGGPLTVSGLFTANLGAAITGGLNLLGTSPLLLNGSAGNAGEILQSNGAGAAPTWSSAFVKGRGLATVGGNESIAVAASVDTDDAINVTLEGSASDMPIPSYYVVRSGSGFTIYFSAPFTGSCNWTVINQ